MFLLTNKLPRYRNYSISNIKQKFEVGMHNDIPGFKYTSLLGMVETCVNLQT